MFARPIPRHARRLAPAAVLALALLVGPAGSARGAATITVCPSGCDHTGIGPAVAAAASGDVIEVHAGTYPAGIVVDKALTIRGAGEATILGGGGRTSVVRVSGKVAVTLERLQLTGGIGTKFDLEARYGGGVYSGDGATTRIVDCLITGNTALEGGGVYHNDGTMTIVGTTITGNRSDEAGGGVYVNTDAVLTLVDTRIDLNEARHPPEGEFSQANGGGLASRGRAEMTGGSISGNKAGDWGGGVNNFSRGELTLRGVEIRGNEAGVEGEGEGGGIWSSAELALEEVVVADNVADVVGGGLFNVGVGTVARSTFSGNRSKKGGGLVVQRGFANQQVGEIEITATTLSGNTAEEDGGGLYIGDRATATCTLCTVSGNTAPGGAGIMEVGASRTEIAHSTIYGNVGGTGSQLLTGSSRILRVGYSLVGRPAGGAGTACDGELASLGYNLDPDGSCGFDRDGDRVEADAGVLPLADNGGPTWTHALAARSPAIDRGHPNRCLAADQRGAPRPVDGDGDGQAACDVGAFEFGSSVGDISPTPTSGPTATRTPTVPFMTATPTSTPQPGDTATPSATPTFVDGPETPTPATPATQAPVVGTVYLPVGLDRASLGQATP